jgi:hypothetical protein
MIALDHEPSTYKDAWEMIRKFIRKWYNVSLEWGTEDYVEKISALEEGAGVKLPPAVREWIRFIERMLETDQWIFRDCYAISFSEELQAITLLIQGEADYYWAVKIENLRDEDPPVDGYHLDYEGGTGKFLHDQLVSSRLTSFLFKYMLDYHYMFSGTGGYYGQLTNRTEVTREFIRDFGPGIRIEDYLVFESEEVIAFITGAGLDSDYGSLGVHYRIDPYMLPACVKSNFRHRNSYYGNDLGKLTTK